MLGGLENPLHILLILIVVLMVFGAKRLPEMGKSLGSGLRGFKESLSGQETSADTSRPALSVMSDPAQPNSVPAGEAREKVQAVR